MANIRMAFPDQKAKSYATQERALKEVFRLVEKLEDTEASARYILTINNENRVNILWLCEGIQTAMFFVNEGHLAQSI